MRNPGITLVHLIRHGETDALPHSLSGRLPGVHLNSTGKKSALRLAEYAALQQVGHIVTSPLERCLETAEPLARRLNLQVQTLEDIIEVDFGEWTGQRIDQLEPVALWKQWNCFRSGTRVPGGESMGEVQNRIVRAIETLQQSFAGQSIALFSHGDLIRAAITYYLGIPLDLLLRLEISPASISTLALDQWALRLHCCNFTIPANFAT